MSHLPHNSGAHSPPQHQHQHQHTSFQHLQHQHQQHQQQHHHQHHHHNNNNNTNSSSNASTPTGHTSFLIKDILRYDGSKRKQRKARTAFSDHQLKELEASFEAKTYLTVQDRLELAAKLKLSDTQVKTWYQNRRTKHKRQTAVGIELLHDPGILFAYQSVLHSQSSAQWLLNHCATPSTQLNLAAAILAAQAQVAGVGSHSGLMQTQTHATQSANNANNSNSNNNTNTATATPTNPHSPQEPHRFHHSDNK